MALESASQDDIERVDFRTTSTEEWIRRFDVGNKPCIVVHGMDDWPAYNGGWTREALAERYESHRFLTDEVDSRGHKMKMSMANYFEYMANSNDDDPIYLFDPKFVKHSKGAMVDDYKILPYFEESFFAMLSKKERPFYRWLVCGPERSGSCFHLDPYNTSAWNALISGEKRWLMFPPGWLPPGVVRTGHDDYDAPIPMKWLQKHYKPGMPGLIECTQRPGEIIWVPSGWWHCVINVKDSVAVTQNLCNSRNWAAVWPEVLRDRPMANELREKLFPLRPELFPAGTEALIERQREEKRLKKERKREKRKKKKLKAGKDAKREKREDKSHR